MGIWNRDLPDLGQVPVSDLITPHGDLEPSVRRCLSFLFAPHYPSWGFGTVTPLTLAQVDARSLPLMGIWNFVHCLTPTAIALLITPHGDLEPPATTARPGNRQALITPHGDLERASFRQRRERRQPLITPHGDLEPVGTHEFSTLRRQLITPHGDLERGPPSARRPAPGPHYPSWGFGTRDPRARGGGVVPLITPHGDLEPPRFRRVRRQRRHLITPHGDLERPPPRDTRSPMMSHYPSWGFGTYRRRQLPIEIQPLITPHGDLEPPVRDTGIAYRSDAHYPSWGFGTTAALAPATRRPKAHYPSWGFGTRVDIHLDGESLNRSLPLMGIWNAPSTSRGTGRS